MLIALPETTGIKIFHHILLRDRLSHPCADFPSSLSTAVVWFSAGSAQIHAGDFRRRRRRRRVFMWSGVIQMWCCKTQLR